MKVDRAEGSVFCGPVEPVMLHPKPCKFPEESGRGSPEVHSPLEGTSSYCAAYLLTLNPKLRFRIMCQKRGPALMRGFQRVRGSAELRKRIARGALGTTLNGEPSRLFFGYCYKDSMRVRQGHLIRDPS